MIVMQSSQAACENLQVACPTSSCCIHTRSQELIMLNEKSNGLSIWRNEDQSEPSPCIIEHESIHSQICTPDPHDPDSCNEGNNVKAYSMSLAYIRYRNATNHFHLSDFVNNCRGSTLHAGISVETTRALKRVMQANPEQEADPDDHAENSAAKVLKTRKPRGVDRKPIAKQEAFLAETHVQYADNFPQHHTMLCLKQVIERTGLSRSTIYNKIDTRSKHHDPKFPKQIVMGSCSVRWLDSEIEEWINGRINFSRCERESD